MRRREFISLAGAAAIWSRVATAEQQKLPFVGVLTGNIADDPGAQMRVDAFRQGMTDLGWSANNNYRLDVRWPGPNFARQEYEARELVAAAPDVILASSTSTARALRDATHSIPVVFVGLSDPVTTGIDRHL